MTTTASSAVGRFFGVAADPQTYRNLSYLALTFPLGILYFVIVYGGGVAGVSLIPLVVGAPLLVAVLAVATNVTEIEARLANGLLGTDIDYESPEPSDETLVEYGKRVATSSRSYRAVAYLLSKFAVGLVAFTALTVAATLSAAMALAPALYARPEFSYQFGAASVETLPVALALSVGGVLVAFASLHVFNLAARALGRYTKLLIDAE